MKPIKKLCVMAIIICLIIPVSLHSKPQFSYASEEKDQSKIIRVGFTPRKYLFEQDESGNYYGVIYDFLLEISKYTKWDYEFVYGDYVTLNTALLNGDIDLLGGAFPDKDLKGDYLYSDYSCGYVYDALFALADNNKINPYNYSSLEGARIGVLKYSKQKIQRLKSFLKTNQINCDIVEYETYADWLNCLKNGEADLQLHEESQRKEDYKIVARYEAENHYFKTNPDNAWLLEELNLALSIIYDIDPSFAGHLYQKYAKNFYYKTIHFSDREKSFIAQNPVIRIGVQSDSFPFHKQHEDGNFKQEGIIHDILDLLSEKTGLKFVVIKKETYAELLALMEKGEIDLIPRVLDPQAMLKNEGMVISSPFLEVNKVILKNMEASWNLEEMRLAVVRGMENKDHEENKNIIYFDNIRQCVTAVDRGEADYTLAPLQAIDYYISEEHVNNTQQISLEGNKYKYCFGISNQAPTGLVSVINKCIKSISPDVMNQILLNNSVIEKNVRLNLQELVFNYPGQFAIGTGVLILLFVLVSYSILRAKAERKGMRLDLERAERENHAKSNFLSQISHEIRTPMNGIIGIIALAQQCHPMEPKLLEYLDKIDASSQYMMSIISDVLDMARIEKDKIEIVHERFNLNTMIDMVEMIISPQLESHEISFEVHREVVFADLLGDELRIKQLLINLLSNAMKFTPPNGKVVLTCLETMLGDGTAKLYFEVLDTGIGIAEDNLERIFHVFEQVRTNMETTYQGTGLGLPISRNLVRFMGGELFVESKLGEGSRFYFELIFPVAGGVKRYTDKTGNLEEKFDLSGNRILLAEDNELNSEIVTTLLKKYGASVDVAFNGQEAVDLMQKSTPGYYSLILMDIQMPVKNGMEAAREIRDSLHEDAKKIPIIAVTANAFRDDRTLAIEAGMSDFLVKPIVIRQLREVLTKYLG